MIYNDRIHGVVLRLQTIMTVFLIKAFHSGRIVHQRNNNLPILCSIGLFYNNLVTVKDACIDHAFTFYLKHKRICVRQNFCRDWEVVLDLAKFSGVLFFTTALCPVRGLLSQPTLICG